MTTNQRIDSLFNWWDEELDSIRDNRQVEWDKLHAENLFGASTLGGCPRVSYWHRAHEKKTNPPTRSDIERFDIGHFIEAWFLENLATKLEKEGNGKLLLQAEAKNENFYAHTDALWEKDGELAIPIEVKSTNEKSFKYQMQLKKQPYPNHALQVATYIYLENLAGHPVSQQAIVWYFSLAGGDARFVVNVSDYEVQIKARMAYLEGFWAQQTVPPIPYVRMEKYPCSFCAYRDKCWKPSS